MIDDCRLRLSIAEPLQINNQQPRIIN